MLEQKLGEAERITLSYIAKLHAAEKRLVRVDEALPVFQVLLKLYDAAAGVADLAACPPEKLAAFNQALQALHAINMGRPTCAASLSSEGRRWKA
jgi:hypothetical protein